MVVSPLVWWLTIGITVAVLLFDIIIIGSGSGNTILSEAYEGLDVALIDGGIFGGTCINVGCIPTKMYVYPAEISESARELDRLGVSVSIQSISIAGASLAVTSL